MSETLDIVVLVIRIACLGGLAYGAMLAWAHWDRGGERSRLDSAAFNQTTLDAIEPSRVVRMRRRDGSVERVEMHLLARYLQREARAMRRELLTRWVRGAMHRLRAAWRSRLAARRLDARERYLAAATDHADFEQRLRAWDRYDRSRSGLPQCLLTWRGDRS